MLAVALLLACRPAATDKATNNDTTTPATDTSAPTVPTDTSPPTDSAPLPAGTYDLADPTAWTLLAAADDPFTDRPDAPVCDPASLSVDLDLFEVDTTTCDYLSAGQPSLAPIRAGDPLSALLYHGSLTWWTDATAHVAIAADDQLLWEATIKIPASSDVYLIELSAPVDIPAGTPLTFHLHNHGSNTWNLGYLRVERQ